MKRKLLGSFVCGVLFGVYLFGFLNAPENENESMMPKKAHMEKIIYEAMIYDFQEQAERTYFAENMFGAKYDYIKVLLMLSLIEKGDLVYERTKQYATFSTYVRLAKIYKTVGNNEKFSVACNEALKNVKGLNLMKGDVKNKSDILRYCEYIDRKILTYKAKNEY